MNAIRRTITTSAAALVAAASTHPVAGWQPACEIVVDSLTGGSPCLDAPQPAAGFSIAGLWNCLAVLLRRQRCGDRPPAAARSATC